MRHAIVSFGGGSLLYKCDATWQKKNEHLQSLLYFLIFLFSQLHSWDIT